MPGKDGVQAVLEVFREFPLRVILATGVRAPSHIHTALSEMVLAYLAKPFQQRELELALERVEQRFVEFQALLASGDSPRQAVEHRKTLRLAKGILMKRNGLGDRAAFQHLQQLASEQNVTLVEVAHRVITAERAVQARPSALQDGNQVSSRS
jgi:AmiR/NasT family two-component response regulator